MEAEKHRNLIDQLKNYGVSLIGCKVVVTKDDPIDEREGIPKKNRWHKGEEMTVVKIEIRPWGIFLYNIQNQNIHIKRIELIN